jgi:hypothetical protein
MITFVIPWILIMHLVFHMQTLKNLLPFNLFYNVSIPSLKQNT